jgi:hypothetical protein
MFTRIALICVLTAITLQSMACDCTSPVAPTREGPVEPAANAYLRGSDTVIRGLVTSSERTPNHTERFRVSVKEVIKGENVPDQLLLDAEAGDPCQLHLRVSEEWVIFLRREGRLRQCMGSYSRDDYRARGLGGLDEQFLSSLRVHAR